ncbi:MULTISPECIES: MucBP domain-containing protein [unclassified Enterococcus]|uniref:MucBP domain-containing protein n=1 Tax=unclassified Enterococcus TaxID=2608891 RepID=UPI0020CBF642|nr:MULTISPECIES: MucBP domain-containing protein [unclassified Enterococcus]
MQGNKSWLFTEEPQTVSYIYTKTTPKNSTITIKYEDSTGNKLADDIFESGIIGELYKTEQKEIVGYTFKKVIGRPEGVFMDENQIITYIYEKM